MRSAYSRKTTPMNERADNLRHTLILATIQKLQRMNVDQLREVYAAAVKIMDGKK